MAVIYLLGAIAAGLLFLVYRNKKSKELDFPSPPGEKFLVGHASMINTPHPYQVVEKFHKDLGSGVVKMNLFGATTLSVAGQEALHEMLVSKGKDFAGRPSFYRVKLWADGEDYLDGIVFSPPDATWKLLRTTAHSHLKMYDRGLKGIEDVSGEVSEDMIKEFASYNGEPLDPRDTIMRTTMNNTSIFLLGRKYETNDPLFQQMLRFEERVLKMFSTNRKHLELDLFPWLRYFGHSSYKEMLVMKEKRNALYELMKKDVLSRSAGPDKDPNNILEMFLRLAPKAEGGEHRIKLAVIDMIVAGTSTSTNTLYSLLNILTHYPEVYDKLQQEIDTVLGKDRSVTLEDRERMPYLRATIFELLRYSTMQPMSDHMAVRDTSLCGVPIPAGTYLVNNTWALHHNSEYFPEPYEFRPERYLDEHGDVVPPGHPNRQRLLPFAAGPRVCVGEVFSYTRLFLMIAKILQRFRIEQDSPKVTCDPRTYVTALIIFPLKYKIRMIDRLKKSG